jgi:hypothetical protein
MRSDKSSNFQFQDVLLGVSISSGEGGEDNNISVK